MHVLLDECVPRALRAQLPGHEVKTVAETGWTGVKNGELLRLAAQRFDVLLTVDRNLAYQQNLANAPIGVIVMHAPTNDIVDLEPLMPRVLAAIAGAKAGGVINIIVAGDDRFPISPMKAHRGARRIDFYRHCGMNHVVSRAVQD